MRRMLVATVAAATLALGLALPASARPASPDPAPATARSAGSAAQPVRPASICPITKGGKVGLYACEYGVEQVTFNGRLHFFAVVWP